MNESPESNRGDYEKLKSMFCDQSFCTVDVDTREARLISTVDAIHLMIDDDPMHRTRAMINAGSALEGFARLKGVGKEDRSFSIDEVAKVAGMPKVTCHNYVQRTIFRPSVSGRTGRGGSAELLFSWHDCYVAGLCGAFRRLGLHPDLLREVSILFYEDEKKKRTGRAAATAGRS